MKFADNLVGKGLGFWIITKFIILSLGWIVALVTPMAVLVSTLMAFGNLAQNNEIAAMKATGISLYRMMIYPFIASILLTFFLVYFNNNIYPDSNHELKILMQDISRKKPTLSLVPGVFSQEMQGYSILAREIEPETNHLKNLTIYDYSEFNKTNVITAKSGKVYFYYQHKKLILDLIDGEIHSYDIEKPASYTKLKFEKHKIAMNGEQFTFQQSGEGQSRSERELGANELEMIADSIVNIKNNYSKIYQSTFNNEIIPVATNIIFNKFDKLKESEIYLKVKEKINSSRYLIGSDIRRVEEKQVQANEYLVEFHKKYSLPFACIVFILIGAPLGTMTRKGGVGMAAGISLAFFIIYWIFLIAGEKLADRNLVSPFLGIWAANIFLGILGLYLTYKTAREKITLDFSFLNKLIPKFLKHQ